MATPVAPSFRPVVTIVSDATIKEKDQQYLEENQVANLMQRLLKNILQEKPKDPIQFLIVSERVKAKGMYIYCHLPLDELFVTFRKITYRMHDVAINCHFSKHFMTLCPQTELEKQHAEFREAEKQRALGLLNAEEKT